MIFSYVFLLEINVKTIDVNPEIWESLFNEHFNVLKSKKRIGNKYCCNNEFCF